MQSMPRAPCVRRMPFFGGFNCLLQAFLHGRRAFCSLPSLTHMGTSMLCCRAQLKILQRVILPIPVAMVHLKVGRNFSVGIRIDTSV